MLKILIDNCPHERKFVSGPAVTFCYTPSRAYPVYLLPRNTLFAQLTGIASSSLHTYACLYGGRLLLAPDAESLSCYVRHLDKGEILEGMPGYRESIVGLSDVYNFMFVADLEHMFVQPESYVRLLPSFFSVIRISSVILSFPPSFPVRMGWLIRMWFCSTKVSKSHFEIPLAFDEIIVRCLFRKMEDGRRDTND